MYAIVKVYGQTGKHIATLAARSPIGLEVLEARLAETLSSCTFVTSYPSLGDIVPVNAQHARMLQAWHMRTWLASHGGTYPPNRLGGGGTYHPYRGQWSDEPQPTVALLRPQAGDL
jgi:hypothetical protein